MVGTTLDSVVGGCEVSLALVVLEPPASRSQEPCRSRRRALVLGSSDDKLLILDESRIVLK